ncbi:cyclohexanone monooxygenase [Paraburkholderia sp. HC6.4b]|uniref:flavin-containing monooxygenase n=1 Tax=unclassified Paraburkholderia TaxID=2615204 RepID=UPI001614D8DB|nr:MULTISPECIES: NAD(P)/FAD-dependent oxidoreductase [unclassified Paraburkholderia]MBB5411282.1 cyclohexanone monooxygenase [Paraburkholderia sp. HC6.4b]MBB5456104.1 cyclohexanone monooxygenase [Paraburkholderia sp. Kb1A]
MNASNQQKSLDVVIVGAGFAGLYQLHRARKAGLTARVIEAGEDVGGTWYWNRYPGARCDVESLDYSFSFDKELEQEWTWSERYATQPEILRYIRHVAERFDLRRDIQFRTRVTRAVFDERAKRWTLETDAGESFDAQFCVMATGCLSIAQAPNFKGLHSFAGTWYHSADWPKQGVDFAGKRVGVIGTGSSGVQMIPLIAEQADHLTVFQRTANFSVPAQNEPLDDEAVRHAKAHYRERRARARDANNGLYLEAVDKSALEVSEEERLREFEFRWRGAGGGFRMLRAFNDLLVNEKANEYVSDFVRSKIRAIVRDPKVAELLCPKKELRFGTKRLCVDSGYYETFNRPNVTLVDVKAAPIEEVTPRGLRTSAQAYELDILVFATGFDAMTGALRAIDIRGVGGVTLGERWQHGPRTYLGVSCAGFPNMFIIAGPGSPSVLSNVVHSIEEHVDWVTRLIQHARETKRAYVACDLEAENEWVHHVNEVADRTLYPRGNSWYVGANIPGKPRIFMPYVGGVPAYRKILNEVADAGYRGFVLS